jgi:hypothetical protein
MSRAAVTCAMGGAASGLSEAAYAMLMAPNSAV